MRTLCVGLLVLLCGCGSNAAKPDAAPSPGKTEAAVQVPAAAPVAEDPAEAVRRDLKAFYAKNEAGLGADEYRRQFAELWAAGRGIEAPDVQKSLAIWKVGSEVMATDNLALMKDLLNEGAALSKPDSTEKKRVEGALWLLNKQIEMDVEGTAKAKPARSAGMAVKTLNFLAGEWLGEKPTPLSDPE